MMRRALIPHKHVRRSAGLWPPLRGGWDGCLRLRCWLCWFCCSAFCSCSCSQRSAQDPSLRITQPPQASSFPKTPGGMFGPKPKIDRAQPLYMQADQLIYDTKGNRVIAQGNVEIYYNNFILTADQVIYDQNLNKLIARRQCAAQGSERLDHAGRPARGARRFPRCVHPVAQRRHAGRHAHCRRQGRPPRGQRHRVRARQVHAVQERCGHAAAVVPQRGADRSRSAGGDDHLPGCAVRVVRRAGVLPALLPASRPVGEAAVGLPDAQLQQLLDARLLGRSALLLRAGAQRRLHLPPALLHRPRRVVAGRVAPPAGQRPVQRSSSPPSTTTRAPAIERSGLARIDPDQGPVLAVVVVALRLGHHG